MVDITSHLNWDKSAKKLVLVLLVTLYVCDVTSAVQKGRLWKRIENGKNKILIGSLGKTWSSFSRMKCIRECKDSFKNCRAIEFDQVTKNCTAGAWIVKRRKEKSPSTNSVFYSNTDICDETLGFSYIDRYDEHVCIHVSKGMLNYSSAEERCKQYGAVLYMPKTIGKFDIFVDERKKDDDDVWLGATDPTGTNVFYWADGERFTPWSPAWYLWNVSQPNDVPDQRCVVSYRFIMKLYDTFCFNSFRFVCEIVLEKVKKY